MKCSDFASICTAISSAAPDLQHHLLRDVVRKLLGCPIINPFKNLVLVTWTVFHAIFPTCFQIPPSPWTKLKMQLEENSQGRYSVRPLRRRDRRKLLMAPGPAEANQTIPGPAEANQRMQIPNRLKALIQTDPQPCPAARGDGRAGGGVETLAFWSGCGSPPGTADPAPPFCFRPRFSGGAPLASMVSTRSLRP